MNPNEASPQLHAMSPTDRVRYGPCIFPVGFRAHILWILAGAGVCTLVFGLFFWWFVAHGKPDEFWGYLFVSLIYSCVYSLIFGLSMPYLIPAIGRLQSPLKWIMLIGTVIGLAAAGDLLIVRILVAVRIIPAAEFRGDFASNVQLAVVISLLIWLIFAGYHHLRSRLQRTELELRTRELETERALKLASEAQLASLESRVHPHFLFNTLNSISALTQEDPVKAERLIQRLAALLRFSLDASSRRLTPLEQEVKLVRDYLEIEKARLGERLSCDISVPEELMRLEVPPLVLQTLVENSIKHAIAPERRGGELKVAGRAEGQQLILEVSDSGPGFSLEGIAAGHGLDNLKGRLATLFDGGAGLRVDSRERGATVVVSMPQIRPGATQAR